jgi:hypothetical protein
LKPAVFQRRCEAGVIALPHRPASARAGLSGVTEKTRKLLEMIVQAQKNAPMPLFRIPGAPI